MKARFPELKTGMEELERGSGSGSPGRSTRNEPNDYDGFKLPAQTRVLQVCLGTADLDRALGFYGGVLGLKTIRREGNVVRVSANGQEPPMVVLVEEKSAKPPGEGATGLFHVAIRYPARADLAWALVRLAQARYPIDGASDHVVSEAIYLGDPDGNGVELYTDRPREQWVWRDGQVSMSTDPLDLKDLLGTVKGRDETPDLPALTDIGHIHLRVGDLAKAERFFHDFLGLSVTQRSYPGALFFAAGAYHHHIAANIWGRRHPAPENSVGLKSYWLEVPAAEVLLELRQRAARFGYEAIPGSESGHSLLRVRDLNGAWLEIISAS